MSKLSEMIATLCPNGVEYKKLGDVVDYEQPSKYIVRDTNYDDSYMTPVLTAGQTFILGYTDEADNHYKASKTSPVIIFDDFTTAFQWVDFEFKVKSSAMKMLTSKNEEIALLKYIYYAMQCIHYKPVDHSRHWIEKYSNFTIPLPPLPVQREIVQILDNFANLTAELTAELAKRKKQYEHYRDMLLNFEGGGRYDKFGVESGEFRVEWKRLGEVIMSLKTGLNPRQNFKLNTPASTCPYVTGKDVFNNTINVSDRTDLIEPSVVELINRRACIENGDVLFASTGTGTVGRMALVSNYNNDWSVSETMYCLKPKQEKILPKYLMFVLTSSGVISQYGPKISKGSVPHLKVADLLNVKMPLPSLKEQNRIVAILDRFDSLCNSLTEGLPAEIALRKKQYEYYRDKLLNFKEAG